MTRPTDRDFAAIRLRVERPEIGTPSQVVADLRVLLDEVLHLRAENDALRQRVRRPDHEVSA